MKRKDRRKTTRISFIHRCTLQSGRKYYHGNVDDISINGARVILKEPCALIVGMCVRVRMYLKTNSASLQISVKAQIAWIKKEIIGLSFIEIYDDDLTMIRRILEVNTGNASKVRKELRNFINP